MTTGNLIFHALLLMYVASFSFIMYLFRIKNVGMNLLKNVPQNMMRNVGLRIGRSVQPIPSVQLFMIISAPQAIGMLLYKMG